MRTNESAPTRAFARLRFLLFGAADPRWNEAEEVREGVAAGFKTPAQACPRGCATGVARRDLVTRSTPSGRVEVRVKFDFETETCPECGSRMIRECVRCKATVLSPVRERCEFCGLPHPWA